MSAKTPETSIASTTLVVYEMQPGVEIKANFEPIRQYIVELLADYQGFVSGEAKYERKDLAAAKKDRAYLKGLVKDIDQRRLEVKRRQMAPVVAFEAKVKELLEPIVEVVGIIDDQIKKMQADEASVKRAKIREHYEDYAGALVDAVPFERIEDPKWLNRTADLMAVFVEVEERVEKIAKDDQTIDDLGLSHPIEAHAEYFATLDISRAIARSTALDEQIAAAARLEEQKTEIMREHQAPTEPWCTDAPSPRDERAPDEGLQDEPQAPLPVAEDPRSTWTLEVVCTRAELDSIITHIKTMGIQGRAVR